ncbi:hypothetical protein DM02DRAFT_665671 [Periconia macrospinosa]|uniref:Spt20-like SEP domain-containing protein n=1 Tax=Periconia macrospinosa TaxID=97972 RepID=A0A2V1CWK0_9PLEO|nr:hypothetical protein DM02DRAFT_665671 [Periconia macrospinosa]
MQELLQRIRERTVPHNMLEELYALQVPFYDHCLIIEVHNYRSSEIKAKDDANSSADGDGAIPFSIHNWNTYIAPSLHVPYPALKTDAKFKQGNGQSKGLDAKRRRMSIRRACLHRAGLCRKGSQPNRGSQRWSSSHT